MKKIKFLLLSGIFVVVSLFTLSASKIDYFEISKNIEIFVTLFKELNINYVDEIDASKTIRKGIDAMLEDLDPYTNFFSEAETEDFRIQTTGKYGGIGSVISQRDDYVIIEDPYEGMPAQEAGLISGDRIISIEGKSMKGKDTKEVSTLLKGAAGTKVSIEIQRLQADDSYKKMKFDVTRKEIKLKNIAYSGMVNNDIGYIKLENFMLNAGDDVEAAFRELKEKNNLKGIILDLRGNPGGLLNEAVKTANVFIDQDNEVVSTRGKIEQAQAIYRTKKRAVDANLPLVILTNGGSASASEIVAGAVQDLDRGLIVGEKTFGKGLVQNTRPLPYNTQLKVTTAKYYIPSGRCIQAINYAEKNPDGSVRKIPDSLQKAFKTKNGRTVYDGGGIDPDIKTKKESMRMINYYLIANGLINDYTTYYCTKNPKPANPTDFSLNPSEFNKFIAFVNSHNFEYKTSLDESLNKLEKSAENEEVSDVIKPEYEALKAKVKGLKDVELQRSKDDIMKLLENSIVKRYYYTSGVIEHSFKNDNDIKAAIDVINDNSKYSKLLK